ncbi:hypothetical protein EBQ26_05190 [Allofranklinella schreckenbergeri]|uniref:Uncharacterized protein n=1 Tax=Allofranklinella schreckenbergeri TaxID=1076744 RepID=A0A3M6Q7P6_9BURK|nr:hypothetical protein [Allofranklinella schreckenbergeri]RMW99182.1 hypothetical protein EBQ26_05190 [Allofranklinella schreckenbergeri]
MPIRSLAASLRHPLGLLPLSALLCCALTACGGGDGKPAPNATQALTADTTYGTQGQVTLLLSAPGEPKAGISAAQLQPDGKLLLAGWRELPPPMDQGAGSPFNRLPMQAVVWRLHADGSLDTSFGNGGHIALHLRSHTTMTHLRWTADGILLALTLAEPCTPVALGFCIDATGTPTYPQAALVRLKADGTLDTGFGSAGIASVPYGWPSALAVQPDGRILWLNSASHPRGGIWRWNLQRYTPSGAVDASFNQGQPRASQCESNAAALALLPDGRILAGGDLRAHFALPTRAAGVCLEALLPDGQRDPSFANGQPLWLHAGANTDLQTLDVNRDGHITLTTRLLDGAQTCSFGISRLTANGALDKSFGDGGATRLPMTSKATGKDHFCALDATLHTADGHTVLAGRRWAQGHTPDASVWARLTPEGQPDGTFAPAGMHTSPGFAPRYLLQETSGRWLAIRTHLGADGSVQAHITRLQGEAG